MRAGQAASRRVSVSKRDVSMVPSVSAVANCVAFVLKGYPRLSETFIAQEILALERRGLEILIASLRHPTDRTIHPVHRSIRAELLYLPEYLYQEPHRVWDGWRRSRRYPGYARARAVWLGDLRRDPTPNRIRRFGACQGYLDACGVGEASKTCGSSLGGDVHRSRAQPPREPRPLSQFGFAVLPRARSYALPTGSAPISREGRQRSRAPGAPTLGRSGSC